MSDIRLFQVKNSTVTEHEWQSVKLEKSFRADHMILHGYQQNNLAKLGVSLTIDAKTLD